MKVTPIIYALAALGAVSVAAVSARPQPDLELLSATLTPCEPNQDRAVCSDYKPSFALPSGDRPVVT